MYDTASKVFQKPPRMKNRICLWGLSVFLALTAIMARAEATWPEEKANAWAAGRRWLVGCNFIPSTAINQLEMWQADTFDPLTIDRELGWAEQLGFTSVRVFLHDLLWKQDSAGFLQRMDQFLNLADKHHIGVTFVFFDSCWNPFPKLGKQPDPKPFVHNSGWVQSPGRNILEHPERFRELKPYVQGVISHYRTDPRVDMWDLFNEPDGMNDPAYIKEEPANKKDMTLILVQETFDWVREISPLQPLTTAVWQGEWADSAKLSSMERVQLQNSDVISFHSYSSAADLERCFKDLHRYNRPVICTEYMARAAGSTFDPQLKILHDQNVGAYNWGFVAGKTQTIYPWDSWVRTYTTEPPVWFHDIFRTNGVPYSSEEVIFIKSVTGK